jgi:hypothetical protein
MYCHWKNHDFNSPKITGELKVVHGAHLVAQDPTLQLVADLPVDMGGRKNAC